MPLAAVARPSPSATPSRPVFSDHPVTHLTAPSLLQDTRPATNPARKASRNHEGTTHVGPIRRPRVGLPPVTTRSAAADPRKSGNSVAPWGADSEAEP